ncbi:MAG TPA: FAD-dependent oxidoreductase, partial [Longimicrobiales bacterium]|nr:FAD-dependent oxidoreductase [Longimicrobiales bacterium]
NLFGGVLPPADMLVWVYSMLDLMAQPGYRSELLYRESVNGFMRSRPYGTDRAAVLHDYVLMVVWSAHSYGVSAAAYRDFFRFTLRDPSPLTWVLKGDLYTHLMLPIRRKLEELGVTLHLGQAVTRIVAGDAGVSEIEIQETRYDPLTHRTWPDPEKEPYTQSVENLVLAVSPKAMGTLAQLGEEGRRLVDYVPHLSEARQARAEPIAVLDLYFNRRIPDIPDDHVSLWDSPMNLSFLDLSQVWDNLREGDVTALTVAASNYYGLPSEARGAGVHQNIAAMVSELRRYLGPLPHEAIDFEKTHFQTNLGDELFINDVASDIWRPETCHEAIPNLFMAGGYCVNDVGMATVEAAVTSGLLAARALHERSPLGDPVEVRGHEAYPDSIVHMMKLALMPAAYQAKWWSGARDMLGDATADRSASTWSRDLASLWSLPARYAVDAWETSLAWYGCLWDDLLGRR